MIPALESVPTVSGLACTSSVWFASMVRVPVTMRSPATVAVSVPLETRRFAKVRAFGALVVSVWAAPFAERMTVPVPAAKVPAVKSRAPATERVRVSAVSDPDTERSPVTLIFEARE